MRHDLDIILTLALKSGTSRQELDEARQILLQHPEYAYKKQHGETAIHLAGNQGNLAMVKLMLEMDPSLAIFPDDFGETIAHVAAASDNIPLLEACFAANPQSLIIRTIPIQNFTGYLPIQICQNNKTRAWLQAHMDKLHPSPENPEFTPSHS